jgi:hypothetical protein
MHGVLTQGNENATNITLDNREHSEFDHFGNFADYI